jgi:hypothetical protein
MGYDTNGMLGIRQINNLHRGNGNGRDVMIFRSREYIQGKMGDRDIDKADLRERKRVLLSQKPSAQSKMDAEWSTPKRSPNEKDYYHLSEVWNVSSRLLPPAARRPDYERCAALSQNRALSRSRSAQTMRATAPSTLASTLSTMYSVKA